MLNLCKYTFVAVILLYCTKSSIAQNLETKIMVESGGSVQFNINSMRKYNEGMALDDWTRLAISFHDTDDNTKTWKLEIKSIESTIKGDYGHDLPLDKIIIESRDGEGTNNLEPYIVDEEVILSDGWQPLVENAPQGDFSDNKIYLSYRIGTGEEEEDALLGNHPDYYTVTIDLRVSEQ